jgi:hypothetical protein
MFVLVDVLLANQRITQVALIDSLHFGFDVNYWSSKDILLFCQETKDSWDSVFLWRDIPRFYQVAVYWNDRRNIWLFEPFRVCPIFESFYVGHVSFLNTHVAFALHFFLQRFLPCNHYFSQTVAIYWHDIVAPIYQRGKLTMMSSSHEQLLKLFGVLTVCRSNCRFPPVRCMIYSRM